MELIIAGILFTAAIFLVGFPIYKSRTAHGEAHFSKEEFKEGPDLLVPPKEEEGIGISKRTWLPLTSKFKEYAKSLPKGKLYHRLVKAGSPMGMLEFLAFKALATLLLPTFALIFAANMFPNRLMLLLISATAGFIIPEFWLNGKINSRQLKVRRDLPNVIDLLTLCVNGGLDFMLAVNRVVRDLRRCDLTIELEEVYRQTQMGKSRRESLKNFAWRMDMPEIYSFVRTLVQADRMGSPVGEALKMQSEEIRVRRFQMGEAMALKAPIKLLFPLFAFILPVVLIIVGGPIIMQFTRGGLNLGF